MRVGTGIMRAATAVAGAIALVLAIAGCSGDAAAPAAPGIASSRNLPADTQKELKAAVESAMAATGSSGAIVGVWAPWSGAWVTGLGTVAPGDKTPVSADMTFRAGAVTRAMTCDALYRMADAHVVGLGDPVTEYVGGVAQLSGVTLLQLCDSTSGIGSYQGVLAAAALNTPGRRWDPQELVAYGVGGADGAVQPGSAYLESDSGYVLLGLALQRASGLSGPALLRRYVFEPLGLTRTDLPGAAPAEPVVGGSAPLEGFYLAAKDKAGAYECDKQTDITGQSASFWSMDAGVVTDIHDLGTYAHDVAAGTLVSVKKRLASPFPTSPSGPAWFTATGGVVQAGPLVGQYGATSGYLTAAFSDPASGLTVAVVLNNSTAGRGVVLSLADVLASIASKAPAAKGEKAPALGLPWSAADFQAAIAKAAVCPAAKK